jgi:hypothetical protein
MEWELLGIVLVSLYAIVGYFFNFPISIPYSAGHSARDERLDQMRGLAMIGIVCIHIHSYFEYFHPNELNVTHWTLFISNLSRFSVPIFIFGSSLYLKKKNEYWTSKIQTLLLPYSIASVLGYFIKYQNYALLDFVVRYLTGQIFAPFYFVPLLFQFYILFYFLPEKLKVGLGLKIFVTVAFVLNILSNVNLLSSYLPEWYGPISIFNYIAFFSVGLFLKTLPTGYFSKSNFIILTLMILFLVSVVIILSYSLSSINLKNHHLVYPLLILLILNQILPSESDSKFFKCLSFIGKNSLYIFLIHPFVIHQMHAIDPFWIINPFFGYIITLIINLSIPSLIAYVITYRKEIVLNR